MKIPIQILICKQFSKQLVEQVQNQQDELRDQLEQVQRKITHERQMEEMDNLLEKMEGMKSQEQRKIKQEMKRQFKEEIKQRYEKIQNLKLNIFEDKLDYRIVLRKTQFEEDAVLNANGCDIKSIRKQFREENQGFHKLDGLRKSQAQRKKAHVREIQEMKIQHKEEMNQQYRKANEMVEAQRKRLEDEGKHQIPIPHKQEEVFWEKIANFVEVKKKEFKSLKGGLREEMIEFIRTLEIEKNEQKRSNIKIATKLKMNTYKESPVLKTGSFSDPPDLKTGSFSNPPDLKTGSFSDPPDLKTGSFSDPPDLKTGSFSDPPDLPINLKENFLIEKYKSFTIELKAEAAGEFEIPRNLSTTSTSPQQYQKGIYVYDDKHFQRYCPIDGSVTNLESPPGRGPQFLVNNEKIWMFAGDSVYAYDPLKNQWTKRLISYVKSGAVKVLCGIEYCWFEGVIHAIVRSRHGRSRTMAGLWQGRTMETITVFCLSRSNNWVEKKSTVSVSSPMRKSHTTACGDSIYLFQFGTKRIYRYRPADDQWNTISFPSDLRLSVFVAYKTKLLFHCHKDDDKCRKDDEKCRKDDDKCRKDDDDKYHDNMVVYDTTTTKFNEYYYPSAIKPSRFTLCNDSIYLLSLNPSSVDRDKSGLCIHQVYKLDLKFLDEATAAPVLSPAPDLTTKISYIWNAVSI